GSDPPVSPDRSRRRLLRALALGPSLLLLSACAEQPATSKAVDVHDLYLLILALAGVVFIGVEGMLLFSIVRFRARKGDREEPPQRYGRTRTIVLFFLIGAVIVAVLYPFGEITLARVQRREQPVEEIQIQGAQWQWSAFYVNEGLVVHGTSFKQPMVMELPVDEPVHIHLTSNDVMHEFFVPAFLFMRNAMPGHPNDFTFTPTELGTFDGQCAEFCGLGHPQMTLVVKVVPEPDFLEWIKREREAVLNQTCPTSAGNQLHVTAKDVSWDTSCLAVTADQPISLTVTNDDAGIDHNFAVWDGPARKHQFFATGKFPGVATNSYDLSALPAGTYYFQCNVHGPAMSGVFIVRGSGSGGSGSGGSQTGGGSS
ncbi:MAG: cytochrome c oxidase subunit II, partial [Candidatus Velamenicoccus archaeovorus]